MVEETDRPDGKLLAVCAGKVRPMLSRGRALATAFVKIPVDGPVYAGTLGLPGDEHQYPDHGGPDQALLVYSHDGYAMWEREFGLDLPPCGAFGENLTVEGLTEAEVCIGDTMRIGEAVVQVTSPRSPCYKIGARYGEPRLPVRMQATSRPGYLLRVLTPGAVQAGDPIHLVSRPPATMTVAEAARVYNRDRSDWPAMERLAAIPELATAMRDRLLERLAARDGGDDTERLFGD